MRDWFFISKPDDHWIDGWTYGDWRQYVCKRPDGSLQCAKVSGFAYGAFLTCFLLILCVAGAGHLTGYLIPEADLNWRNIYIADALSVLCVALWWLSGRTGWTIMTAVGPRQYDGRRVFSHEVTK